MWQHWLLDLGHSLYHWANTNRWKLKVDTKWYKRGRSKGRIYHKCGAHVHQSLRCCWFIWQEARYQSSFDESEDPHSPTTFLVESPVSHLFHGTTCFLVGRSCRSRNVKGPLFHVYLDLWHESNNHIVCVCPDPPLPLSTPKDLPNSGRNKMR